MDEGENGTGGRRETNEGDKGKGEDGVRIGGDVEGIKEEREWKEEERGKGERNERNKGKGRKCGREKKEEVKE